MKIMAIGIWLKGILSSQFAITADFNKRHRTLFFHLSQKSDFGGSNFQARQFRCFESGDTVVVFEYGPNGQCDKLTEGSDVLEIIADLENHLKLELV